MSKDEAMMSETKWTKGPWRSARTHGLSSDTWYVITDDQGYGPVIEVGGKDKNGQIAEAKYLITDPETITANAHLIAAAPELYDELERLVAIIEDHEYARWGIELGTDESECFQTYKLLAKARGEQ